MNWINRREDEVTEAMLSTEGQAKIRSMVKGLSDDELSMAWRSQLNLKLLEAQDKKNSRKLVLRFATWGSSIGVGATAMVAIVLMTTTQKTDYPQTGRIANLSSGDLAKVHQESTAFSSVSGTGVSEIETNLGSGLVTAEPYQELL